MRFTQSVELFNALRRIERPGVLLEYSGQDHDFDPPNLEDLETRKLAFFDHFLKGEKAPEWWSAGVSIPGTASAPGATR